MEKEEFYNKIEEIAQNTNLGVRLSQKIKTKIKSWKIFGGKLQPDYIDTPKELVEKLKEPIEQYVSKLEKINQNYKSRLSQIEKLATEKTE